MPVISIPSKPPMYTAEFTDLKSAITQTLAHGFGRVPIVISTRLVCIIDDTFTGMVVGQESKLSAFFDVTDIIAAIAIGWDDTNFYLSFPKALSHKLLKRDVKPKIGLYDTKINVNGDFQGIDANDYKVVITYM